MRHTWTVSELSGLNRAQAAGDYIEDFERDFVTRGVVVGSSTLYNKSKGLSALVTGVTSTRVTATGTNFVPGEMYVVSLDTAWTVQTPDGPLIEVECNICGFSYPAKELTKGRCKVCIDKPKYAKS